MNIREKEELKQKLESLEELIKCIDSSFTYEHSQKEYNLIATAWLGQMLMLAGDKMDVLNILIRSIRNVIVQIKVDLEY